MNYYWNKGARQLSSYLQPTHKQLCEDNKVSTQGKTALCDSYGMSFHRDT